MTRPLHSFRTPFPGTRRTARLRHGCARRGVRPDRAFTLIELVVTISIIIVLVSLTVYAGVALIGRSEARRTQDTLAQLDQAVREWELTAQRSVSLGENDIPPLAVYDINEGELVNPPDFGGFARGYADDVTRKFLAIIARSQPVRDMIAQIDSRRVKRDADDFLVIVDAWDRPIRAVFPGRAHLGPGDPNGGDPDDDGTIESANIQPSMGYGELAHGAAVNKRIFFVSAGPDGQFGNLSEDADDPDFLAAGDNVYSYQPEQP
jgi:type II secretory pathway pseudopilin PulG